MRRLGIGVASILLAASALGCCVLPQFPTIRIPEIDINVPTIEIGEVRESEKTIPASGEDLVDVSVAFGVGELELGAGDGDELLAARFVYNVDEWEPEVTYDDGELSIRQGSAEGIPAGEFTDIRNEWSLAFSPEIPFEMDVKVGAGDASLDFTDLQLTKLDVDMGAGDFEIRFDEPNRAEMRRMTLDAGAAQLGVFGIGNAGPERVRVQGGAGEITLDFTGAWPDSAEVTIMAGVGQVTLRLPKDIGVHVEKRGGITSVEADGFKRLGDAYVNDAFGETETELRIEITAGVGSIKLIEVDD